MYDMWHKLNFILEFKINIIVPIIIDLLPQFTFGAETYSVL